MNKNILHILIAVLIIFQIVSLFKINDLLRQIENIRVETSHLSSNTRSEMNAIYYNVDEMLKQEARLIEKASTEIGAANADDLTVPITFFLTPKEVSEHTSVNLDFNGEIFPMDRKGTTFFVTVPCNIFDSVLPLIVIDENGIKKSTQDDRINISSMKHSIFPTMYPHLTGGASYIGKTYKRQGFLSMDVMETAPEIIFTKMRFVIQVDDETISDEAIPLEMLLSDWKVDKTISLSNEQICIMKVIATDTIGLEHHFIVDYWAGNPNTQTSWWFNHEQIYSADGKLLWEPEYEIMGGF